MASPWQAHGEPMASPLQARGWTPLAHIAVQWQCHGSVMMFHGRQYLERPCQLLKKMPLAVQPRQPMAAQ